MEPIKISYGVKSLSFDGKAVTLATLRDTTTIPVQRMASIDMPSYLRTPGPRQSDARHQQVWAAIFSMRTSDRKVNSGRGANSQQHHDAVARPCHARDARRRNP